VNVQAVSALLAALLTVAIGTSVLLKNRTDRTYTSFAAFTFMVSAWQICTFVAMATTSPMVRWLALWPAATIPPTAIAFFRSFLAQPSIGGPHRPPRVTLAWTFLAYLGLIYSAVIHPIHESIWFQIPFGAYVFGGLYRCVYDMWKQYRATVKQVERARVRYLALGGFVTITLTMTDVLPRLGVAWPTVGNVFCILYLYFLSQTLFRYRLLDVNELVGKMAVLGALVVLLWAVYGLLLSWVGGGQEGLYVLNAVVASFVILILFEPVRSRLENGVNRWLVRQRTELRGRLDLLRRELANVVDIGDMVHRITAALEESRRVTDGSVYLLDPEGAGFDRAGWFGQPPPERLDTAGARAFLDRIRSGHLDLEILRREHDDLGADPADAEKRQALAQVISQCEDMHADLVFPLYGSAETELGPWLLGLLAVRDDRAGGAFDLDDTDTFRQLAVQAARVIESNQAYERVKERDRLAALGEMSAGLAHEIRNPLGAIKGAAQLLVGRDGRALPPGPETAEFIGIIVEEVDRLNNVVTRFLDYARTERAEPALGRVELNAVVRKTIGLLQQTKEARAVEIRVRLDDLLPAVSGDPEALVQVFLNLGLNAVQAMPDGGVLEILTTRRRRSRLGYGQFAEIRFRDTGIGIARDKLKKLFIPFYTTKSRGTGLGLAISQRIVSQHSGTIEVRSTPGQGSTFSVFLPALTTNAAISPPVDDDFEEVTSDLAPISQDTPLPGPLPGPGPVAGPPRPLVAPPHPSETAAAGAPARAGTDADASSPGDRSPSGAVVG
jgi:two-component system sensor histidine kinase HydH